MSISNTAINNCQQFVRTKSEADSQSFWWFMHPNWQQQRSDYRACFSEGLLANLKQMQGDFSRSAQTNGSGPLKYLVLASDADVFNLGGDLALFSQLIREKNRDNLLAYARRCVDVAYAFNRMQEDAVHTIAVVQGDALGGGFEAALCCHTIIAEEGVQMGFPEVLFDLFPGMGAYSFLCKRVAPATAERMMLDGNLYSTQQLHRMGIIDVLVPRGEGLNAARDYIRRTQRIGHARWAMNRVRNLCQPVSYDELMRVTEIWVDTAIMLGEKSLRTMERLVAAQQKRGIQENVSMEREMSAA